MSYTTLAPKLWIFNMFLVNKHEYNTNQRFGWYNFDLYLVKNMLIVTFSRLLPLIIFIASLTFIGNFLKQ